MTQNLPNPQARVALLQLTYPYRCRQSGVQFTAKHAIIAQHGCHPLGASVGVAEHHALARVREFPQDFKQRVCGARTVRAQILRVCSLLAEEHLGHNFCACVRFWPCRIQ